MKTNNYQTFRTIVDSLSAEVVTVLKIYINIEPDEIKKRVIRKIIGIKEGATLDTDPSKNRNIKGSMDEDSEEEELESLKRQRVRVKAEGKDSTKNKQKKSDKIKRLKG
jgi:pantothenate kinase